MAIGSPDKAARLAQLGTYAAVQVRSGYRQPGDVRADIFDAVIDEVREPGEAQRLTDALVAAALREVESDADGWPELTDFDRLEAAFADLEAADLVVLQACEDHWSANQALQQRSVEGATPWGIAHFTHPDVWHAVEHGMLEVNLWHGSSANVAPGDDLLTFVLRTLADHGIAAAFDEGRIEVTVAWQRRLMSSPRPGG